MVVNELRGEKVDIVPFSADPAEFVMRALSPAKVKEVQLDADRGVALVIVPDSQLSLAIGKEGQNARLAYRLTGWQINVKSETQLAEADGSFDEYGEAYAQGEWVRSESGELMFQPADGSAPISAADLGYSADELADGAPDGAPAAAAVGAAGTGDEAAADAPPEEVAAAEAADEVAPADRRAGRGDDRTPRWLPTRWPPRRWPWPTARGARSRDGRAAAHVRRLPAGVHTRRADAARARRRRPGRRGAPPAGAGGLVVRRVAGLLRDRRPPARAGPLRCERSSRLPTSRDCVGSCSARPVHQAPPATGGARRRRSDGCLRRRSVSTNWRESWA